MFPTPTRKSPDTPSTQRRAGLIYGLSMAIALGAGFVPVRKAGKLPWAVVREEYHLEYGSDKLEMHRDAIHPGERVLVIDDSNTIRRSAEIFLRQGGHEVLLAEDGFDALAKVNDHVPQLIFCDILMPRLDGYQTCAIIKRNPRFAHVPVIMLSSKDGLFDKARGRMVGSQDYLTKPFTKEQLLRAVQQFGAGGDAT